MTRLITRLQIAAYLVIITCGSALSRAPDPGGMEHDDDLRTLNMISAPIPLKDPNPDLNHLPAVVDPLFTAVRDDDVNYLLIQVKGGRDVNIKEKEKDKTPLMVARSFAMAATLIKHGANVRAIDADGRTALHHAVFTPQAKFIIELLVKKGADINARNTLGITPLATCIPPNKVELVELLLKLGADRSIPDTSGHTPLDTAYSLGQRYIVQILER